MDRNKIGNNELGHTTVCKLSIDSPGFFTTVQDRGRIGYQQYGMPVAGAMDQENYLLGQALVGNTEPKGALECTVLAPTITVQGDCIVAFTGADMEQTINGRKVPRYVPFKCQAGDVISGAYTEKGVRLYIAFSGGIDVPTINDSVSTHTKAKIGGFEGRHLKAGDELYLLPMQEITDEEISKANSEGMAKLQVSTYELSHKIKNTVLQNRAVIELRHPIRVVLGPQHDAFTEEGLHTFSTEFYELTVACDRMGYRLRGEAIEHTAGADIISDGAVFGSIQVPADGEPIILMADRQTTGGYTKIGTVITPDLPRLSQMPVGYSLEFEIVTVEDSQNIYRAYMVELNERLEIARRQSAFVFSVPR